MKEEYTDINLDVLYKLRYENEASYQKFLEIALDLIEKTSGLKREFILGKKKKTEFVEKRYMIFAKARQVFGKRITLKDISKPFGKSYSDVCHALKTHKDTSMKKTSYEKEYLIFSKKVDERFSLFSNAISAKRAISLLEDLKGDPSFYERGAMSLINEIVDDALHSHLIDIKNFYSKVNNLKNAQK